VLDGLSRVPLPLLKAGSPSKAKGHRELKNLKCSINYEGSSRGKDKRKRSDVELFGLFCGLLVSF
jgi:hypothetical protein